MIHRPVFGLVVIALIGMLAGCSSSMRTIAEDRSGYTYVPLDPFPATELVKCPNPIPPGMRLVGVLEALPDNAVRMSVEEFSGSAGVSFGVGRVGAKGSNYRVTIDFINSMTVQLPFWIRKTAKVYQKDGQGKRVEIGVMETTDGDYEIGSGQYAVERNAPSGQEAKLYKVFNVPIYVGVGLRVVSNVTATEANVDISGLGSIGVEAEGKRLSGSLVVQTLGVNGKAISAALPIQSELNRTTVQNAVVSVSAIKTQLYSPETIVSPRVVGIYVPFPADQKLINALISALSGGSGVSWTRPCVEKDGETVGPTILPP